MDQEKQYTHSNQKIINSDLGQLILKAKDFILSKIDEDHPDFRDGIDGQPNSDLIKALGALSRNPRSFYDKEQSCIIIKHLKHINNFGSVFLVGNKVI